MSALSHILASEPGESAPPPASSPSKPESTPAESVAPPLPQSAQDAPESIPAADPAKADGQDNGAHASATLSTRRNASGSVSSVYSGNKIKHLKKEDGIPLWRKDIQYQFLRLVFYDQTRCFTKYSDGSGPYTFAEIYIDAMAKSSKTSRILKEKLSSDVEGAVSMAMVCLLVNVGRMNTTLNFFPEMRAQLRTYHSIPALQAHQDPNAYKQLQDAPRLKSILKGATEDKPQPSTLEDIRAAKKPRTNPVNLIFVMSQYAPKISETHFQPPRDFFDLVMRGSLSSASRARAFLWLIWWYLESDFTAEDALRNPFGPGQYGEGEDASNAMPLKVPTLESLTEEQAALENVDTREEMDFGEVKRKERIAILASEPSPAMTALKRARKEKGLINVRDAHHASDDEASEHGWLKGGSALGSLARSSMLHHETGSEYTRSPSPPVSRAFPPSSGPKPPGDMRINNLLNNDDSSMDVSTPHPAPVKKGPGRGNWRRNRDKPDTTLTPTLRAGESSHSHHVPLLPNTGGQQLSFVHETPSHAQVQPATPGSGSVTGSAYNTFPANGFSHHANASPSQISSFQLPTTSATRDSHVPTPSYQAQKRKVTQHQSALISHRRQQIDYTLDRRIRHLHARARSIREDEGAILRAWKRIRLLPVDYDSEEEAIKARKMRDKPEKEEDWRLASSAKGKENAEMTAEEAEALRKSRILLAGLAVPVQFATAAGEKRVGVVGGDVGEQARSLAKAFRRTYRRLERWEDVDLPGKAMIRRRQTQMGLDPRSTSGSGGAMAATTEPEMEYDGFEFAEPRRALQEQAAMRRAIDEAGRRAVRGRSGGHGMGAAFGLAVEDGGGGGGDYEDEERDGEYGYDEDEVEID